MLASLCGALHGDPLVATALAPRDHCCDHFCDHCLLMDCWLRFAFRGVSAYATMSATADAEQPASPRQQAATGPAAAAAAPATSIEISLAAVGLTMQFMHLAGTAGTAGSAAGEGIGTPAERPGSAGAAGASSKPSRHSSVDSTGSSRQASSADLAQAPQAQRAKQVHWRRTRAACEHTPKTEGQT